MSAARALPEPVMTALKALSPHASGMHILRMGASMLSIGDPTVDSLDLPGNAKRAARLQAQMPALVAHTYRLKNGQEIVEPKPEHGLAEGFLYMLEGKEPEQASTFAGRVVIGTDSDMVSALTAAIGALKGPKHGGVPGPVLTMLEAIGTPENADAYIRNEMNSGRRIMGFGHRIYKVRDPRAALLGDAAQKMAALTGDDRLLKLTEAVEQTTVKVLAELKPGRDLYANVELYAALILHAVGVPSELFTPIFAIGRTSGWTAHMLEQLEENRLIRPNSIYVGPKDLKWQPIEAR
jgi:citrate synthase